MSVPKDDKKSDEKPDIGPILLAIGPLALTLRKRWVLPLLTFAGAVVAVFAPFFWADPIWTPYRIAAGVVAALAIIADRVADTYEKKLATITFRESERSAEKSVADLNVFLSEAIETTFLEGAARAEAIKSLRRTLVRCAAGSIGDGSRASYYPMRREAGGSRILDTPFHHNELGRKDKPDRPWIETVDVGHEVWAIMSRADEETEVCSVGDDVPGLDWEKKKYKTFYSVPVKANMVQFGFLSVNNSRVGAIGGPQRATVLAMARTLALVIAAHKGPKEMNTQARHHQVSVPRTTLSTSREGNEE